MDSGAGLHFVSKRDLSKAGFPKHLIDKFLHKSSDGPIPINTADREVTVSQSLGLGKSGFSCRVDTGHHGVVPLLTSVGFASGAVLGKLIE